MAYEIAAQPGIEHRDFKVAEKLASHANELTHGSDPEAIEAYSHVAFESGQYDKALQLENEVVKHGGNPAGVLDTMSLYNLRLGRFQEALDGYSKLLGQNPMVVFSWAQVGTLQLYLGQVDAYKATCRGMMHRFGKTGDVNEAAQTAKLCLLTPNAASDMDAIQRLTDMGLSMPGYDAPGYTFILGKGMAEYRAGHFLSAISWLQRCAEAGSNDTPYLQSTIPIVHATARFYIAMAERRLGDEPLAQANLAAAQREFAQKVPTVQSHNSDVGGVRWIIAQLAAREANAMFAAKSPQVASQTH